MNYRFETLKETRIIGVAQSFENGNEMQKGIPQYWEETNHQGITDDLIKQNDQILSGVLGVIISKPTKEMDYMIGVTSQKNIKNKQRYEEFKLEKNHYIVIDAKGPVPKAIKDIMPKIYQELLPHLNIEVKPDSMFEHYLPGNTQSANYITEIWIPIQSNIKM